MGTQQNRREGVVTTKMQQEFSALGKKPIGDQSKFFLNRYMEEFEGKFSEVLEMSETFRKIAASDKADENVSELNEVEFLRFLTTQGRTMTRDQMRKTFASVDFDKSGGVSFIEWLCFRYEKRSAWRRSSWRPRRSAATRSRTWPALPLSTRRRSRPRSRRSCRPRKRPKRPRPSRWLPTARPRRRRSSRNGRASRKCLQSRENKCSLTFQS